MFWLGELFANPLRPPGAVAENDFQRQCVRCGKCATVCPHGSIRLHSGLGTQRGTPFIDPAVAPCKLCMKCQPVCPTNALDKSVDINTARIGQAYILKSRCHNHTTGIMCSTCYDRCPLRGTAIIMEYGITPAITDACAGCGVCLYVCPVHAIELVAKGDMRIPENALPVLPAER